MKIAAKYIWDVVRFLENEKTQGKDWFLWDQKKEFYKPSDFICFEKAQRSSDHVANGLNGLPMPVKMILQSLHRQLLLNSLYPFCVHIDIRLLYHQYWKDNPYKRF